MKQDPHSHAIHMDQAHLRAFEMDALKHLSPQAFLALGMGQVVYIKPVEIDGKDVFALTAADGTLLTLVDSTDGAHALAVQNDFEPVCVQ